MRICLFAGPCVGKSTIAAYVFARLKILGINIEIVNEYVKNWAYEKRPILGSDQFYIFAKQWRKEDVILRNGVDHIITDSPLLMQCMYAMKYGAEGAEHILPLALLLDQKATGTLNIFLERVNGQYQPVGRYQTEKGAREMDSYIETFLAKHSVKFVKLPNDCEIVTKYCIENLKLSE